MLEETNKQPKVEIEPNAYKCQYCNYTSNHKSNVTRHQKSHIEENIDKYYEKFGQLKGRQKHLESQLKYDKKANKEDLEKQLANVIHELEILPTKKPKQKTEQKDVPVKQAAKKSASTAVARFHKTTDVLTQEMKDNYDFLPTTKKENILKNMQRCLNLFIEKNLDLKYFASDFKVFKDLDEEELNELYENYIGELIDLKLIN